jgi:UDP-3-O-[3-hydroxymyristoyl] glucosamine N-acyltransferase
MSKKPSTSSTCSAASEEIEMTTFDFDDGKGPVPAHKHYNGGGWVADTAKVADTAHVGRDARVYGNARVSDNARVFGSALVYGDAKVFGKSWVYNNAVVVEQIGNEIVAGENG